MQAKFTTTQVFVVHFFGPLSISVGDVYQRRLTGPKTKTILDSLGSRALETAAGRLAEFELQATIPHLAADLWPQIKDPLRKNTWSNGHPRLSPRDLPIAVIKRRILRAVLYHKQWEYALLSSSGSAAGAPSVRCVPGLWSNISGRRFKCEVGD